MLDNVKIVADARSWIGVKFRKGGRDRTGIDCIGLLIRVGEEQGLTIRDDTQYSFNPEPAKFTEMVFSQTEPLSMNSLRVGSILVFRQTIFPMHTGILARDHHNEWSVINANAKERRVVEQPLSYWKANLIAIRAYKE